MSDVPVAERAPSADGRAAAPAGSALRSARSELEAAATLHRAGAFDAAAAGYRAVLARRPDDIDALQLLGAAEVALGRAADALPRLQRALALCPAHAAAHNHHGLALAALGRLDGAEAAFDAATRHAPGLVPAWVNLAATRVQRGASVPAIDAARRALALDPAAHDARVPLGTAWLALGDAAEAAQVLGAVPADAACAAEACLNLGHAWRALGRLDDARGAYDRGLAALATAAPRADASLHGSLMAHAALLALDRGDSAAAATGAQQALQVAPADTTASRVLARALRRLGRPAEALVVLDALLGARPDDTIAWQERAQSALALQRVDDALDAYTRALALAPQQPWLFGQWLHTKLKACDWDGLEPAFQRLAHGLAAGEPLATPFQVLLTPLPPSSQQQAAQV
ncbi:MAG: tetratricopeptide repeat protein, partial [Rubrivivax sp.]